MCRASDRQICDRFPEVRVFHTFGVPEIFVSDNVKQFVSKKLYNVKHWSTSRYHLQTIVVEATIKTVAPIVGNRLFGEHFSAHGHEIFAINFWQNMIVLGKSQKNSSPNDVTVFSRIFLA